MNAALQAHCIETTLTKDRLLVLGHLPFRAGETAEVVVLTKPPVRSAEQRHPLRDAVIEYTDPFEPVAEEDWEALQ